MKLLKIFILSSILIFTNLIIIKAQNHWCYDIAQKLIDNGKLEKETLSNQYFESYLSKKDFIKMFSFAMKKQIKLKTLNYSDNIKRGEIAEIIQHELNITKTEIEDFELFKGLIKDIKNTSDEFIDPLTVCFSIGLIFGENGYLYADNFANRAEAIAIINNFINNNMLAFRDFSYEDLFYSIDIPKKQKEFMMGKSMKQNDYIAFDDLVYINLAYYGFDDKIHIGELVVNKKITSKIISIFKELLENKFPIEKMVLVDYYDADDEKSMEDNNSSSFNYRNTSQNKISNHSYGIAIDINPKQNPYIYKDLISPKNANDFINRNVYKKGMIFKNDVCYNAFIKQGFTWGGEWVGVIDYQHFEIKIK